MKKKMYEAPSLKVHRLQPAQIICTSCSTDSPTGRGSSFGGNSEEDWVTGSSSTENASGSGSGFDGNEIELFK